MCKNCKCERKFVVLLLLLLYYCYYCHCVSKALSHFVIVHSGVFRIWQRGAPWSWNSFWKPQIRPFFWNLETQKTIKHCWILQFLLENGKKRTFSYKVACKKFSWSGQRGGGHRTMALPLNTPLGAEWPSPRPQSSRQNISIRLKCTKFVNLIS